MTADVVCIIVWYLVFRRHVAVLQTSLSASDEEEEEEEEEYAPVCETLDVLQGERNFFMKRLFQMDNRQSSKLMIRTKTCVDKKIS